MTIADLVNRCRYEQVEEKIRLHYGDNHLPEYRKLYSDLEKIEITHDGGEKMYVYINAYKPDDDEFYIVNSPELKIEVDDEDDSTINFDVSAYCKDDLNVYSIASMRYSNFMRLEIDEKTLKKFSPCSILAHCLWEITAYGFEDRTDN